MNVSRGIHDQTLVEKIQLCIASEDQELFFLDDDTKLLSVRSNGHCYIGVLEKVCASQQFQFFSDAIKAEIAEALGITA